MSVVEKSNIHGIKRSNQPKQLLLHIYFNNFEPPGLIFENSSAVISLAWKSSLNCKAIVMYLWLKVFSIDDYYFLPCFGGQSNFLLLSKIESAARLEGAISRQDAYVFLYHFRNKSLYIIMIRNHFILSFNAHLKRIYSVDSNNS